MSKSFCRVQLTLSNTIRTPDKGTARDMQRNHLHEHLQDVVDRMFFLFRSINRSKAELLQCIYIFDSHDLARGFGAASTSAYLVRVAGIAASTAFEYVRVARQIVDFPALMAAFAEGAIDYSTVRLLLKYLTEDNEFELVELAKQHGHEQMKKCSPVQR